MSKITRVSWNGVGELESGTYLSVSFQRGGQENTALYSRRHCTGQLDDNLHYAVDICGRSIQHHATGNRVAGYVGRFVELKADDRV
jgi:hypothetical protein